MGTKFIVMNDLIETLETTHSKLSKCNIESLDELKRIMFVLGLLNNKRILNRIHDIECGSPELTVDFFVELGWFESKGEVRRLIKNNGIRINNKPFVEKVQDIEWIKIDKIEFAIVKKGKVDFDFIFNNFEL